MSQGRCPCLATFRKQRRPLCLSPRRPGLFEHDGFDRRRGRGSRSARSRRRDQRARCRTGIGNSHRFVARNPHHACQDRDDEAERASWFPGFAAGKVGQLENGHSRRDSNVSGTPGSGDDLGRDSDHSVGRAHPDCAGSRADSGLCSLPGVRVAGRCRSNRLPRLVLQEWRQCQRDDPAKAPPNPLTQLSVPGRSVPMGGHTGPRLESDGARRCAYRRLEVRGRTRLASMAGSACRVDQAKACRAGGVRGARERMRSACTCSRCRRLRLPISSGHRVPTQPLWERAPASATPVPVNRCGNYGCAVARLAGDDTDVAGVVSGRTGAASWWATTRASTDCPTIADIGSVRRRDNDELSAAGW